jgi:hypothetical protein
VLRAPGVSLAREATYPEASLARGNLERVPARWAEDPLTGFASTRLPEAALARGVTWSRFLSI